jgi:hypothetical protein
MNDDYLWVQFTAIRTLVSHHHYSRTLHLQTGRKDEMVGWACDNTAVPRPDHFPVYHCVFTMDGACLIQLGDRFA